MTGKHNFVTPGLVVGPVPSVGKELDFTVGGGLDRFEGPNLATCLEHKAEHNNCRMRVTEPDLQCSATPESCDFECPYCKRVMRGTPASNNLNSPMVSERLGDHPLPRISILDV